MSLEQRIESMAAARREMIGRLEFQDAGAWLGEPAGFPLAAEATLPRLRELLAEYGIAGALLSHWSGQTVSPGEGNRELFAALEAAARESASAGAAAAGPAPESPGSPAPALLGVATGLPLLPRELGAPPEPLPGLPPGPGPAAAPACHPLLAGVRVFPRSHNFPLTPWMVGGLCAWLLQHRLPLFVRHEETDWPALHGLAAAFPELPIVVETQVRKILYHSRPLFRLLEECPNVLVETSNLVGADFLAYAARRFGARRLLFASFLPANDPLAAMGMVLDADLPEADKRLIAGENLRRLVGRRHVKRRAGPEAAGAAGGGP